MSRLIPPKPVQGLGAGSGDLPRAAAGGRSRRRLRAPTTGRFDGFYPVAPPTAVAKGGNAAPKAFGSGPNRLFSPRGICAVCKLSIESGERGSRVFLPHGDDGVPGFRGRFEGLVGALHPTASGSRVVPGYAIAGYAIPGYAGVPPAHEGAKRPGDRTCRRDAGVPRGGGERCAGAKTPPRTCLSSGGGHERAGRGGPPSRGAIQTAEASAATRPASS